MRFKDVMGSTIGFITSDLTNRLSQPVKSQESDMSIESLPFQNRVVEYDETCESRSTESSVSLLFIQ
jgi:hypothetical protein